ncbi:hypothetical protein [Candidatus Nitrospira bockiana]
MKRVLGISWSLARLNAAFLLNVSDLQTSPSTDAHVMPGLTVGVRC